MAAANSRIEDADMAEKFVEFSKNQILSQSSLAMLAQANSQSQNVLALLR
jgi:flagellin